jgi:TonB family protein
VRAVAQESELARMLREGPAGVVIIDGDAVTRTPLDRLTARLKLQFPQLVLIVLGNQRDQGALADQVARGTVYRFLLKPTTSQRLKVAIDTAWLRHEDGDALIEHGQQPPSGGGIRAALPWIIAAGVLVATAGGVLLVRHFMQPSAPEAPAAAAPAAPPENGLENLLARADAALAGGAYENAADLYREAQRASPGDPRVKDGLSRVVRRVLAAAQTQLLDRHIDRAQALAKEAVALDPDNPQVSQLVAQISAAQDHAVSAPAAGATPPAHAPEAPPEGKMRARLDEHLRHSQELMAQGHLLEPAQDSARSALRQAREIAPSDPRVKQQQRALLELVMAEARKAIAAGHADEIDRYIAPVVELGARPEEIAELTRDAQRIRAQPSRNETDRIASQFNERLQQGKIVDPASDSAKYYFSQLVRVDPNSPATQIARLALGAKLLAEAQSAVRHQDFQAAKRWLAEARDAGGDATSIANVEAELMAAQAPPAPNAPKAAAAPAAPLIKIRNVDPEYPDVARSRRLSGTVDVQFTVREDGTTTDFAVISAQPAGVFEQAALDAVRKWRYHKPVSKDGTPTQARAQVRLNFAP